MNRDRPARVSLYVLDNERQDLGRVPFRLKRSANRLRAAFEVPLPPAEIGFVGDDYFELIHLVVVLDDRGFILLGRQGHPVERACDRIRPARLEVDDEMGLMELIDQWIEHVHRRLPTGDDNDSASARDGARNELVNRDYRMTFDRPTFLRVAPRASHIAAGEADEVRGSACPRTLTLDGIVVVDDGVAIDGTHQIVPPAAQRLLKLDRAAESLGLRHRDFGAGKQRVKSVCQVRGTNFGGV